MIHPTAVVHSQAKLGAGVRVGPHAVIDANVELGVDCVVGPHAYLTGLTMIGARNKFHAGCVIGGIPQDLKYQGDPTRLQIGDDNTFREGVTVNCSTSTEHVTVVGSNCLFMTGCHIAHDCVVGNHVIIANSTALAGHVTLGDRVVLSACVVVHQFLRIGTLVMVQGGAALSQEVPPFTLAHNGLNRLCGLNIVGLRRAGLASGERLELKRLYRLLFRSGKNLREAIAEGRNEFTGTRARELMDFVASSKRGVCRDIGFAEEVGEAE